MINKKIILFSLLLILVLIISCTKPTIPADNYTIDQGILLLDKEGTIPQDQCTQRKLNDKIIVLESKYCGACKAAVPLIKEVGKELNVNVTFLDLATHEDTAQADKFGVLPYYTPTMVAGCKVYIGGKTKTEYTTIMKEFLDKK